MIGFWKVTEPYGQFSNWWLCRFIIDGQEFASSEQAFMWAKAKLFKDDEVAVKILQTTHQAKIKALGREVKNFDPVVWDENKYNIMVEVNFHKFNQNPLLAEQLLATEKEELVEASPLDTIWGIGLAVDNQAWQDHSKWRGTNLLGQALMNVRELLKEGVK